MILRAFNSTLLLSAVAVAAPSSAQAPATLRLGLPVACVMGKSCEVQNYMDRDPGPAAKDYRCGSRTYQAHSGIDIRLPDMAAQRAGIDVLAAADGKVLRVRDGVEDISVRDAAPGTAKNQECGNGLVIEHAGGFSTQYCHMAKGSLTVRPGDRVNAGAALGRVGLSGNTEYPHLHMTVRKSDVVVDPFAPMAGSGPQHCGAGEDLWRPDARAALAYKVRVILNAGFTTGGLSMAQLEAGGIARPNASAPALVVYIRALGLQAQDVQSLTLIDPSGKVLAANVQDPLPRDQAQRLIFVGKPRPSTGWAGGRYRANYVVKRDGVVVLERTLDTTL